MADKICFLKQKWVRAALRQHLNMSLEAIQLKHLYPNYAIHRFQIQNAVQNEVQNDQDYAFFRQKWSRAALRQH